MGTPILGTVIAAKVTTGNTDNTFAVADANEIQGGHHAVSTIAERDAIPDERRVEGMTCWVIASGTASVLYRLVGGVTNANWVESASSTPSLTSLTDVSISNPSAQQVLTYSGSLWVAANASTASVAAGAAAFYLGSASTGTGTYKQLSSVPVGGTETVDTVVVTSGSGLTALGQGYLSSYLNRTELAAGLWACNVYGAVDTSEAYVVAAINTRSNAGAETELFRLQTPAITGSTPSLATAYTTQSSTAVNLDDKLLVKFYGTTTGTVPTTLTLYSTGTTHASNLSAPLRVAHNDLDTLQGGGSGGYYHLTAEQSGAVSGAVGGSPTGSNPFVTQQALVIEQGTRSQEDQHLQNQITDLAQSAGSVKAVINAGAVGQSLVGTTAAGTVGMNSLSAGAGITLASDTNSVLISAGTKAEIGYEDAVALEVFQDYATGTLPVLDGGIGWDGPAYGLGCSIAVTTGANGQQSKCLRMAQGEYARKLSWGKSWLKMRFSVGMRFNGTVAPTNVQIYMGVCSGTNRPFTTPNTLDWFGGGYDGPSGYSVLAVPAMSFTYSPFRSRRYGVDTHYGQGSGSPGRYFSSTGSLVSVMMGDIIRAGYTGTQTYSLSVQSATSSKVAYNASYSNLLHTGRLHDANAADYGDGAIIAPTYDDSVGPHDSFSFVYTGEVPIDITYICVTRVH